VQRVIREAVENLSNSDKEKDWTLVKTASLKSAANFAETFAEVYRAIIWHIIPTNATASIIPPVLSINTVSPVGIPVLTISDM
jgi:hypothetical protein